MIAWSDPRVVPVQSVYDFLERRHYLGGTHRGIAWSDEFGVMVLANPTSRRLPHERWLEISRWCLLGVKNGGSQQWGRVRRWLLLTFPEVDTVVSYSDPSQGHTGALYKACNFVWSPTWHRLSPPPTGNGNWGSGPQSVKDRWIYQLRVGLALAEDRDMTIKPPRGVRLPYRKCVICGTWKGVTRFIRVWMDPKCAASAKGRAAIAASFADPKVIPRKA